MNASMPRWIMASIGKTLTETADDLSLVARVELVQERTKEFEAAPQRVEIRITGPYITETSKGYYTALVAVNVLLMTHPACEQNAYASITYAGRFAETMSEPIPVFNYGSETGDYVAGRDSEPIQLGCLETRPKRPVAIRNFGQVDPAVKLDQQEISASYTMSWQE
jgi:hypothetical protein